MARGRPTSYKKEYCKMLIEHGEEGLSFDSFCAVIGVCDRTIYRWLSEKNEDGTLKYPDFSQARRIADRKALLFFEKAARSGMLGKIKNFNASVWVFTMKNRFGWKDKHDIVTRDETVKDPEEMTDSELDERVAYALKILDGQEREKGDRKSCKDTGKKRAVRGSGKDSKGVSKKATKKKAVSKRKG